MGHAGTAIRIASSMQARAIVALLTSKRLAPKVATSVDPLLAPLRRQEEAGHAETAILTAGSMQARAIVALLTSKKLAPKAAASADDMLEALRLEVFWNSHHYQISAKCHWVFSAMQVLFCAFFV